MGAPFFQASLYENRTPSRDVEVVNIPFLGKSKKGRTCVLHIGMHKTGSTSIQYTLQNLPSKGPIQYAVNGPPNHSGIMAVLFSDDPTKFGFFARQGNTPADIDELKKHHKRRMIRTIKRSTAFTLVFSAEVMTSKHFAQNGPRRIRTFLEPYFEKFHVVGYVRGPKSNASSKAQEQLKTMYADIDATRLVPDYKLALESWLHTFSDQKVTLKPWKTNTFPEGNVVLDFAQTIGLELAKDQTIWKRDSLCLEAVALLYADRIENGPVAKNREAVRANLRMYDRLCLMKGRKFVLSDKFIDPAIEARRSSIRWVEDYLGEKLEEDASETNPSVIERPEQLLAIAEASETKLHHFVSENVKALNGQPRGRSELFRILRME